MEKYNIISKIKETGIIAVIRGNDESDALRKIEGCAEGGIKIIELTFTVPFAHKIIENIANIANIANRFDGEDIIIGAGTVLDPETARIAILSGAEFVVSPSLNTETIRMCNRYRKLVIPGIMTVSEAILALEAGVDIIKLFPGEVFGPSFIKALKGPLPHIQVMPTGGVDIGNVGEWIRAGAIAVGAGSLLTEGNIPENAKKFIQKIKEARA